LKGKHDDADNPTAAAAAAAAGHVAKSYPAVFDTEFKPPYDSNVLHADDKNPAAAAAGYVAKSYPAVFDTEFKRPTPLPAKLQAVVSPAAQPALQCAVLTANGEKDVILGRLYSK
jgi:hypothetical protein